MTLNSPIFFRSATRAGALLHSPDEPLDDDARARWIAESGDHDPALFFDELPAGPEDPPTPAESVSRMEELLGSLLAEAPLRDRRPAPVEEGDAGG